MLFIVLCIDTEVCSQIGLHVESLVIHPTGNCAGCCDLIFLKLQICVLFELTVTITVTEKIKYSWNCNWNWKKLNQLIQQKNDINWEISKVNFLWITHPNSDPILYMEISQPQPMTAVSRLAASHHWSASSSWHKTWWNIVLLRRSPCQTRWTLNWWLILPTARTTQDCKNYLRSRSRMPMPLLTPLD